MEFSEVVRRRRMVRRYLPDRPVPRDVLDRLVATGLRAPSAGSSQGWHFLVLDDPAALDRFWTATTDLSAAPDNWLTGMRTAPALVVVLSDRRAYEERYSRPDKSGPVGAPHTLEERWPVPYWHLDAAMAGLLVLLAAVDAELGACFFGVPTGRVDEVRECFRVPAALVPVGVISVGYPNNENYAESPVARRHWSDVVSYGSFGSVRSAC